MAKKMISYYCILFTIIVVVLLAVGGETRNINGEKLLGTNKNKLAATARFMLTGTQCPGVDCGTEEAQEDPHRFCQLQDCGNCNTVSIPGKAFCEYKVVEEEEDNRPDVNCEGKKCSKKKPTPDEFCNSYKNCDKCSGTEDDAVCTYVTVQPMIQFMDQTMMFVDHEFDGSCAEVPCRKQEKEEDEECYEFKDVCGRCDPIYPGLDGLGVCLYKEDMEEEATEEATEEEEVLVENEQ